MRNYLIKFSFLLSLFMIVSIPVAAESDAIKVYDKGLDVSMRYYSVACPNGKNTTITQTLEEFDQQELIVEQIMSESGEELVIDNTIEVSDTGAIESLSATTQNLKQKFLDLFDKDQLEMCLYPINSEKQCKSYKDVDAAAKAACDLIR